MKKTTAETILLVDDNPVNRTLLKKILEKEGYRVAEAEPRRGPRTKSRG